MVKEKPSQGNRSRAVSCDDDKKRGTSRENITIQRDGQEEDEEKNSERWFSTRHGGFQTRVQSDQRPGQGPRETRQCQKGQSGRSRLQTTVSAIQTTWRHQKLQQLGD